MVGLSGAPPTNLLRLAAAAEAGRARTNDEVENEDAGADEDPPGRPSSVRLVIRGIGVYAAVILTIMIVVWDSVSIGTPPPSLEWALVLLAGNVIFLVGGWYALYYWPRHGDA